MTFECTSPPGFWHRAALVTPGTLTIVSVAIVLLLAASLSVGIDFGRRRATAAEPAGRRTVLFAVMWLAVLFSITLSAKLLLMREVPVTVPFWDAWDAEGVGLFVPFQHCSLSWPMLFNFHNEHRVFFSRVLALDLLALNGQWDPRLEQVVNAFIHSITAVAVAAMFWSASRWRRLDIVVLVCVLAVATPAGWENTLLGFQSAFYFLLLFGVLAVGLMTSRRPWSGAWWLGWMCAVCGIFTAAGGFLAPAAVAVLTALTWIRERRDGREALINVAAALLVVALGVLVMSPPLAHNAVFKARTVSDFATALGHNLAWPWISASPFASLVLWAPLGVLLAAVWYRRAATTAFERLILGVALWVGLQAAAVAYGRGSHGVPPVSRYLDFLSVGFVANAMAMLAGVDRVPPGRLKRVAAGAGAAWLLFAIVGVHRLTYHAVFELKVWQRNFSTQTANVRTYLITNDRDAFVSKTPGTELPYPEPQFLASLLQKEEIRRILPAAVRPPVPAKPLAITNDAFVPDGSTVEPVEDDARDPLIRTWGSYGPQRRAALGRFDSEPVAACVDGRHLLFQVSGYLGQPHHYLAVKDLKSGREVAVRPSRVPGESWVPFVIACPSHPFSIVAIDDASDSWFAFREPVETGELSVLSEGLIKRSGGLLFVALGLAFLAARWTSGARPDDHPRGGSR